MESMSYNEWTIMALMILGAVYIYKHPKMFEKWF